MGQYGNGASIEDIAHFAGISEGAVVLYTRCCFDAIESLHDAFVCRPTAQEKEYEKWWIENWVGFRGSWRDGWVMYDGTIVVLFSKPGIDGDACFTHKSKYGLNLQVGNLPSNLQIVDYAHGLTGSAHDASAFEHTAAVKHSDWFFGGNEFAWMDSAYPVTLCSIPVHKQPASLLPENTTFNHLFSHLHVCSEHCMGALKGRWQCLHGLRTVINSKRQHKEACAYLSLIHTQYEEEDDRGLAGLPMEGNDENGGEQKWRMLVEELIAFREMQ
ncbi:hypothetical protein BDR04DRAFT_1131190 [Suillus decipiens]|nr:hypothetical protein BDR04DRAFT_1131190 [Suillus decipiens]